MILLTTSPNVPRPLCCSAQVPLSGSTSLLSSLLKLSSECETRCMHPCGVNFLAFSVCEACRATYTAAVTATRPTSSGLFPAAVSICIQVDMPYRALDELIHARGSDRKLSLGGECAETLDRTAPTFLGVHRIKGHLQHLLMFTFAPATRDRAQGNLFECVSSVFIEMLSGHWTPGHQDTFSRSNWPKAWPFKP